MCTGCSEPHGMYVALLIFIYAMLFRVAQLFGIEYIWPDLPMRED